MLGMCAAPDTVRGYTLMYFDARGAAETIRFLFAIAKVPYTDQRFKVTFGKPGDFSTISRPEFDSAKAAGEFAANLGKVPILDVDGVKLGQSKPIERFLAREFGMLGANSVEAAQIEALCEHIIDFKNAYNKAKGATDEAEKKKAVDKWFAEDLPSSLQLVEKSLPDGPGPWLVGSKVSLADVAYFMFLASPKGFFDNAEGAKAAFSKCPRLKAALEAVEALPEVKDWIAKRPDTVM